MLVFGASFLAVLRHLVKFKSVSLCGWFESLCRLVLNLQPILVVFESFYVWIGCRLKSFLVVLSNFGAP